MAKKEINMTEGNPLRRMLVFGAPVMAGGILQQMYNMADAVIAGRFIGGQRKIYSPSFGFRIG